MAIRWKVSKDEETTEGKKKTENTEVQVDGEEARKQCAA